MRRPLVFQANGCSERADMPTLCNGVFIKVDQPAVRNSAWRHILIVPKAYGNATFWMTKRGGVGETQPETKVAGT